MGFDVVITGATVHDGTGRQGYRGDVGVEGGRITHVGGSLAAAESEARIDGQGKVLCPGFVDMHSHADTVLHWDEQEELLEPLLRQGITTFLGGNCGMGLAPHRAEHREPFLAYLDAFLGRDQSPCIQWETMGGLMEALDRRGVAMNCAFLAPHAIIRIGAMGMHRTPARRETLRTMQEMLDECLEAGVMGMSTGLQYFPGLASDEEELVALARQLSAKDAIFTSHIRSYSNTLPQAIEELMSVSRRSGARVQLSHLFWVPHYGLHVDRVVGSIARLGAAVYKHVRFPAPLDLAMREKLETIGRAIDGGLPMGVDAMPTGAGFTHLIAFFPPWAIEGKREDIFARISDPATRQKIYQSIMKGQSVWPHREDDTWSMNFFKVMGWKAVHLMSVVSDQNQKYVGKDFVRIARERGQRPFDAICDMLLEEEGRILVFETPTWPGDEFAERSLHASIADPNVSIATDTLLIANGKPSHLYYDCYPRLLGRYVRDEKLLSLPEAIRKSTSLPARQMGLRQRGEVREGYWADLVLFDEATIGSRSTPDVPAKYPTGIDHVLVNGAVVVTPEGLVPGQGAGKVIRRGDS